MRSRSIVINLMICVVIVAVTAFKSGKPFHEESTAIQYRRVAPITLNNHCLKCHMPDRKSTKDRRAGLVVTIPMEPRRIQAK